MFRANNFDKLLDKATSNLRLEPDWPTILQICDLIRQNDCTAKYAVTAVKKKLYSQNPHQAMFALLTLESVVKNCGSGIHDEVASKAFCENLRDLVKTTPHENLKTKILELIQAWAFAFRNSPKYRAVQDTVNILKAEGYKFPTLKESDAMFSADTAPEWADGEVCHRCRIAFSLMVRRHHCRACGQVFCQQCSSKTSTLPKFGIEKEVRVCDACFDKVSRPPPATTKLEIVDTSNDYGPTQPQKRTGKSAEELQEEEELQLALALSQSEAEQKEKDRRTRPHPPATDTSTLHPIVSSTSSVSASPDHSANAELSRYLDRNYWEQRSQAAPPTAPSSSSNNQDTHSELAEAEYAKPVTSKATDDDEEDKEIDEFVDTLKSQIEIFVNRMKSNSSRGRSIANDTAVQNLFMNITTMHSKLLKYIQQQDDKRVYLESLQDKVSQIRDSRAALDTLRAENAAREAAAAEAAERQRQMQMASKLQAMRKKKHEYLQYQRQLALQRVQEQEREMQMRQEQQKHQYMMSANSGYFGPGMSMPPYQPGYPAQPVYANPQYPHQTPQIMPQTSTDVSNSLPGQPLMSQANVPMNMNQMGPMPHSSQLPNPYSMPGSGAPITQTQTSQAGMNQPNIRSALNPALHQHMMMQHMQMRMPGQPGGMPMMPPNAPNSLPGQQMPQQNGQNPQLQKPNLPSQSQQQPNAMIPQMNAGQNIPQSHVNPGNPMVGMQMQNMRMPMMQSQPANPNQQIPVSGYQMNMQNLSNQPTSSQPQTMQQPSLATSQGQPNQGQLMGSHTLPSQILPGQMSTTTQSMPMPGSQMPSLQNQAMNQNHMMQMPGQPIQGHMGLPSHMQPPQGQNIPPQQMLNNQQGVYPPGQQPLLQGQPGHMQGLPMPQNLNQPQMQGQMPQQMGPTGQQMGPTGQQIGQAPMPLPNQQMGPQNPQLPTQNQQMPQGQATGPQNQPMPPNPTMGQIGQTVPGHPQNMQPKVHFANGAQNQIQQDTNTPPAVKSERNNNTAELISFD